MERCGLDSSVAGQYQWWRLAKINKFSGSIRAKNMTRLAILNGSNYARAESDNVDISAQM
jgi:hypothetical protein